jgi:hypothetical protein
MSVSVTRVARVRLGGRGRPEFLATSAPPLSWQVEADPSPLHCSPATRAQPPAI